MPITFECPHCGKQTDVADEYAGQTGPCAACGQMITVPASSGDPPLASTPSPGPVASGGDPMQPQPGKPNAGNVASGGSDARTMAMLAHLLGALLGFLGPLVIWLVKKDASPFVDDQGKEALNFQLTLLICYVASVVLYVVVSFVTCGIGGFVPFPLIVTVFQLVFGIIGAVKASNGEYYRYPFNIRVVQ